MYRIWPRCHHFFGFNVETLACQHPSLWKVGNRCHGQQMCDPSTTGFLSKRLSCYPRMLSLSKGSAFIITRCNSHDTASRLTPENGSQSKALILWSDLKKIKSTPRPAIIASVAGLLPFVCPSLYFVVTQQTVDMLVNVQTFYGALTLSFFSGIQWGRALAGNTNTEFSRSLHGPYWCNIIPVLVAWIGLMLPYSATLLALIGGHGYSVYQDVTTAVYPSWFRALRFIVSLVAIVALWTTFICSLSNEKPKNTKVNI